MTIVELMKLQLEYSEYADNLHRYREIANMPEEVIDKIRAYQAAHENNTDAYVTMENGELLTIDPLVRFLRMMLDDFDNARTISETLAFKYLYERELSHGGPLAVFSILEKIDNPVDPVEMH